MFWIIFFEGNVLIELIVENKLIYYKRLKDKIMIYVKVKLIIFFEKCFKEWKGKFC